MFDVDFSTVSASIEIFPKGEYEFVVGDPKPHFRLAGDDNHESYGIRYPLTIAAPDRFANKRTVYSTYLQSEGGQSFAKQFLMAALGYDKSREAEARFNEDMKGKDWQYDHQTGVVGDAWRTASGTRVIGTLDVGKNPKDGSDTQQFKGWRPIHSGPISE